MIFPLVSYIDVTKVLDAVGFEAVVVRLPAVWGANDSIFLPLARSCKRGIWAWPGGGSRFISSVHVENASAGLILLAEKGESGEVYNLCDDVKPTLKKLFGSRLRAAGCSPWMTGDAYFSRDLPLWVFWGLVVVLEWIWAIFRFSGAPPVAREAILIASKELTMTDKKARKLGYKPVTSWEEGLVSEGKWSRSMLDKRIQYKNI